MCGDIMKIFQISRCSDFLSTFDLANLFNVYEDVRLENSLQVSFNINKTMNFTNLDKLPKTYYTTYIPKQTDTWLLISYYAYGTTELWWLLCKLNGVKDPTIEPYTFNSLKILTTNKINQILSDLRTG